MFYTKNRCHARSMIWIILILFLEYIYANVVISFHKKWLYIIYLSITMNIINCADDTELLEETKCCHITNDWGTVCKPPLSFSVFVLWQQNKTKCSITAKDNKNAHFKFFFEITIVKKIIYYFSIFF